MRDYIKDLRVSHEANEYFVSEQFHIEKISEADIKKNVTFKEVRIALKILRFLGWWHGLSGTQKRIYG